MTHHDLAASVVLLARLFPRSNTDNRERNSGATGFIE
jgi:hypothetical protein